MNKIKLGRTNLEVSQIGFGTSSLHHIFFEKGRQKILKKAYELGFTHFDTAPLYGFGIAEKSLGKFLKSVRRENISVATKVGLGYRKFYQNYSYLSYVEIIFKNVIIKIFPYYIQKKIFTDTVFTINNIEHSFEASMKNLSLKYVDILFLHEPTESDISMISTKIDWLLKQKQEGRVRYLGLAGDIFACRKINESFPNVFEIYQCPSSIDCTKIWPVQKSTFPLIQITYGYFREIIRIYGIKYLENNFESLLLRNINSNDSDITLISSLNFSHLEKIASVIKGARS